MEAKLLKDQTRAEMLIALALKNYNQDLFDNAEHFLHLVQAMYPCETADELLKTVQKSKANNSIDNVQSKPSTAVKKSNHEISHHTENVDKDISSFAKNAAQITQSSAEISLKNIEKKFFLDMDLNYDQLVIENAEHKLGLVQDMFPCETLEEPHKTIPKSKATIKLLDNNPTDNVQSEQSTAAKWFDYLNDYPEISHQTENAADNTLSYADILKKEKVNLFKADPPKKIDPMDKSKKLIVKVIEAVRNRNYNKAERILQTVMEQKLLPEQYINDISQLVRNDQRIVENAKQTNWSLRNSKLMLRKHAKKYVTFADLAFQNGDLDVAISFFKLAECWNCNQYNREMCIKILKDKFSSIGFLTELKDGDDYDDRYTEHKFHIRDAISYYIEGDLRSSEQYVKYADALITGYPIKDYFKELFKLARNRTKPLF